jgi:hypothetical protein
VTVVFTGLSCSLLIATRDGGDDLGLVEPLGVALALRRAARDEGDQRQRGQDRFRSLAGIYPDRPKDSP